MRTLDSSEVAEFLYDSKKRGHLAESMVGTTNIPSFQPDLFGGPTTREEDFNNVLSSMAQLYGSGSSAYRIWDQETKGGKVRRMAVPKPPLRTFLEEYFLPFVRQSPTHAMCHGGEPGYSPKGSLETHLPIGTALSFDLASAFENVPLDWTYELLLNLAGDEETANLLGTLSTIDYGNQRGIPVGSPIGMALFNRTLTPLDIGLAQRATERNLTYTRWVDDITLSSPETLDPRELLGAVFFVDGQIPVSRTKTFIQRQEDGTIYLLGQKITPQGISKNSKKDREENKMSAINLEGCLAEDYDPW